MRHKGARHRARSAARMRAPPHKAQRNLVIISMKLSNVFKWQHSRRHQRNENALKA